MNEIPAPMPVARPVLPWMAEAAAAGATFRTPFQIRFPADLYVPGDPDELWTATCAVHEAAHTVVAVHVGLTVHGVWIGHDEHPDAMALRARVDADGRSDEIAIVAAASRPATYRFWRDLGVDSVNFRRTMEDSFSGDVADIDDYAVSDRGDVERRATALVTANWSTILGLAQHLLDAGGTVPGEQVTAFVNDAAGQSR